MILFFFFKLYFLTKKEEIVCIAREPSEEGRTDGRTVGVEIWTTEGMETKAGGSGGNLLVGSRHLTLAVGAKQTLRPSVHPSVFVHFPCLARSR